MCDIAEYLIKRKTRKKSGLSLDLSSACGRPGMSERRTEPNLENARDRSS